MILKPQDNVYEVDASALYRKYRYSELALDIAYAHVIEEHVLTGAQHGFRNDQELAERFSAELGYEVTAGDKSCDGYQFAKKVVTYIVNNTVYIITFSPQKVNRFTQDRSKKSPGGE